MSLPYAYRESRVGNEPQYTAVDLALAERTAFQEGAVSLFVEMKSALRFGDVNPAGAINEARRRYPLPQLIIQIGNVEFSAGAGRAIWRDVGSHLWQNDVARFLTGEPERVHKILKALLAVLEDHAGFGL